MTVFPEHQCILVPQYKEMKVPGKLQCHLKNILLSILKYPYIYIVSLIDTLPEISTVRKISLQQEGWHWSDTDFSYPRSVIDIQGVLSRVMSKFSPDEITTEQRKS